MGIMLWRTVALIYIADILPDGVLSNIPPFKGSRPQLTDEDTVRIAAIRTHVERAIGRIKNYHNYHTYHNYIP